VKCTSNTQDQDDDLHENIINYDDEDGSEDMTVFDIITLQIRTGGQVPELPAKLSFNF
jgi:hypothetical protein